MKKEQAVKLIEQVFDQKFDETRFSQFCVNLFNDFNITKTTPVQTGKYIYEPYIDHIKSFKRIGQYVSPVKEIIDVLAVKVKSGFKLERTRTGLRNFAIEYLKRKGNRDTVLIAFYADDSTDWRLSFVKLEYKTQKDDKGKIKAIQEATSARRYSFLVGENEPCHTAKKQFLPLLVEIEKNPDIEDIESCFNIEKVTKEFFEQYKLLFLNLKGNLDSLLKSDKIISTDFSSKSIETEAFAKKLLGQIVFLYFIQKKGWLGVPKNESFGKGNKRFLKSLYKKSEQEGTNFFNAFLEPLFYEALAVQRSSADPSYYRPFDCRIPFLNGGLFEPIKDYDWKKTEINLPNELFSNREITKDNDIGTGILDVFDRYNFTVKEDEPLDKEVAVDPEMLGKVFENLLEVKDRKSKGTYYTPREIVHYMCQESLINYLDTSINSGIVSYQKLADDQTDMFGNNSRSQTTLEIEHEDVKILKEDIDAFIKNSHLVIADNRKDKNQRTWQLPDSIKKHAKLFDKALADVKVCDPAIGSGAFPVGMLNEIIRARTALTPFIGKKETDEDRTQYHLKRECIQNSLYGVDIDESAIDIAKLRLWLSLVVDEESIQDIEPLPNLDYKIVCGNSLLGIPDGVMHNDDLEKEIESLKTEYFNQTSLDKKRRIKSEINHLFDKLIYSMSVYDPFVKKIKFDLKTHFSEIWHVKNGFDIIIGNPPYGASISNADMSYIKLKAINTKNSNSAALFIDFAKNQFVNEKGTVSFIVPKSLLYSEIWFSLATALANSTPVLIDVEKAFEKVKLEQVVFVYCKGKKYDYYSAKKFLNSKFIRETKIEVEKVSLFKSWICDVKKCELLIAVKMLKNSVLLNSISTTKRGVGLQKYLTEKGKYAFVGGVNISRYHLNGIKGYVNSKEIEKRGNKLSFMLQKKIISQDLIAHVQNPKPHIKIMAYYDENGDVISLDTVQNTIIDSEKYTYYYVLSLLNSSIVSWYTYKFIYCSAIRTMHFDRNYIGKIPIPNIDRKHEKIFQKIVQRIIRNKNIGEIAEIDARIAHLYTLTESEYQLILEGTEDNFKETALKFFRDIEKGILK